MADNSTETCVIRQDVVKHALESLRAARIHPHFAGYLALVREAKQLGQSTRLPGDIEAFYDTFLVVPGGPKGSGGSAKPYFRPFWHKNSTNWAQQCWFNPNVAGSYAPSSLRETLLNVVHYSNAAPKDQRWALKAKHWELARQYLTSGNPVPVFSLAVFLYRNFAFVDPAHRTPAAPVAAFRDEFGYWTGPAFDHLFHDDLFVTSAKQLFEGTQDAA